jgi:hypothetical protein
MANVSSPNTALEVGEVQATVRTLGLEETAVEVRRAEDIAPAFEALKGRADALYVAPDPLVLSNRVRINALALGLRLPTMYAYRDYVETGWLTYTNSSPSICRSVPLTRRTAKEHEITSSHAAVLPQRIIILTAVG